MADKAKGDFFLPDFCGLNSVFAVVVLSQLFALILTLAGAGQSSDLWHDLAMTSLFMQWAGLSCAALLCACRSLLSRLSDTVAGMLSYLLLLGVIALLTQAGWWLSVSLSLALIVGSQQDFFLRNMTIGAIVVAIALRYFYVQSQWRKGIRAESEARLQALQARIRPHFLFNSINTVSSLIHRHPDQAEEALLDLADLFRANLREERRHIPLAEELALIRQYLKMEGLRLGERLEVQWQLDEGCEAVLLPALLLQPLVENAVYHGVEPRPQGGVVRIAVRCGEGQLVLEVANPLPTGDEVPRGGNQMAMQNIRQRLHAHYGDRASLQQRVEDGVFEVRLSVPLEVGI